MELNTSVQAFPGIGPARGEKLDKLGLRTAGDLLRAFPRDYEDRREVYYIQRAPLGEKVCVRAMVAQRPTLSRARRGMDLVKVRAVDVSGVLEITFFNQTYVEKVLSPEVDQVLQGRQLQVFNLAAGAKMMPVTNDDRADQYSAQIVAPILADGEIIGGLILLNRESGVQMNEIDRKVAETTANIVGRQMEQ